MLCFRKARLKGIFLWKTEGRFHRCHFGLMTEEASAACLAVIVRSGASKNCPSKGTKKNDPRHIAGGAADGIPGTSAIGGLTALCHFKESPAIVQQTAKAHVRRHVRVGRWFVIIILLLLLPQRLSQSVCNTKATRLESHGLAKGLEASNAHEGTWEG